MIKLLGTKAGADIKSLSAKPGWQQHTTSAVMSGLCKACYEVAGVKPANGGISGGTLVRPALRKLLQHIKDGLVDQIVVYTIDRLTRSLADFSKIVDTLDAADMLFVSVTQSFNTATNMGRLTLNMLLSFAQLEREVTAERIRGKIAVDLSRFDAAPLIAFTAPKETDYETETDGRISLRSGAYRAKQWAEVQSGGAYPLPGRALCSNVPRVAGHG